MENKKINKETIIDAIDKTAEFIYKKHELYENVKKINEDIKALYEHTPNLAGTFGFKTDGDYSNKNNISGFAENPNISFIAQLEKEMGQEGSNVSLNDNESLKIENEKLKEELKKLKTQQGEG